MRFVWIRWKEKKTFMYRNFKWEVKPGLWVLNITNSSIPWSSCISQKPHQILSVRHGFLHLPNNCEAESGVKGKRRFENERKKSDLMGNLEVLMFLIKSPARICVWQDFIFSQGNSVQRRLASRCCCCFLSLSVCLSVRLSGGGCGGEQDVKTSEWV